MILIEELAEKIYSENFYKSIWRLDLEAIKKNPENLEVLVDQFLWINTSLGNWSYVLLALESEVKLVGKEKADQIYEEMLNYLQLVAWIFNFCLAKLWLTNRTSRSRLCFCRLCRDCEAGFLVFV